MGAYLVKPQFASGLSAENNQRVESSLRSLRSLREAGEASS